MSASSTSHPTDAAPPAGAVHHEMGPERTQWLQLAVVCVAGFVVWSGFGAILPYLPVFLQEQARASVWLIGIIASAYYVGSFAFAALFGRLSDRIGRKPVILCGIALFGVAQLLFISTTHPTWFIFFRFLEGSGAAAVSPAAQALVADLTLEKDRSRAYGWLTSAQFGGLVAGPLLAWPLYELGGGAGKWAFYTIFLFGSALSFVTTVCAFLLLREPEHARRRRAIKVVHPPYRSLITKPILAFLLVTATGSMAMGVFEVLWSLWLRHLGASVRFVGSTWMAFSAPMLLSFVGGYLADRYNRWYLWFSGSMLAACAWVYYGLGRSMIVFLVVNVIEGLAFAWSSPARQAFFTQVAPARWLGSIQGLDATSMQLAALIGTLVAPVLYGYISGYVISIAGGVSLVGLAIAAPILYREWNRVKMGTASVEEAEDGSTEIPLSRL